MERSRPTSPHWIKQRSCPSGEACRWIRKLKGESTRSSCSLYLATRGYSRTISPPNIDASAFILPWIKMQRNFTWSTSRRNRSIKIVLTSNSSFPTSHWTPLVVTSLFDRRYWARRLHHATLAHPHLRTPPFFTPPPFQ